MSKPWYEPTRIERTYHVRFFPIRSLTRAVHQFSGRWMLCAWTVRPLSNGLYEVYLKWRSDVPSKVTFWHDLAYSTFRIYARSRWLVRLAIGLMGLEDWARRAILRRGKREEAKA